MIVPCACTYDIHSVKNMHTVPPLSRVILFLLKRSAIKPRHFPAVFRLDPQGLGCHRHSAAQFEEPARRRGLQLICIDRPGRGFSDPVPSPEVDDEGEGAEEVDVQGLITEAVQEAVVDTVKQVRGGGRIVAKRGWGGVECRQQEAWTTGRCVRVEAVDGGGARGRRITVSPWGKMR